MSIGIIGTGNMGTILTQALIDGGKVNPKNIFITNRTIEKANLLKENYPEITIAENPVDVIRQTDIIFLCIKPLDIKPMLDHIKHKLTANQIVISITSPITVEQMESVISSKAARIIPSINNRGLGGSTLITYGSRLTEDEKRKLWELAESFSVPTEIDESITRVASDLSSCGPAFISYLLERMIEASVSETKISREQATILTTEMIIGLGRLLEKDVYSLETLRKKVHVKGGVTGEGLKVLEDELGEMFQHLFQKTHEKFKEDHFYVDQQFNR
jgi:competence protein ComER